MKAIRIHPTGKVELVTDPKTIETRGNTLNRTNDDGINLMWDDEVDQSADLVPGDEVPVRSLPVNALGTLAFIKLLGLEVKGTVDIYRVSFDEDGTGRFADLTQTDFDKFLKDILHDFTTIRSALPAGGTTRPDAGPAEAGGREVDAG